MAYRTAAEAEHEVGASAWLAKFGFGEPRLGRPQDLEPALADDIGGAYALEQERHVDPTTLTAGLAAAIRSAGGRILTNERVVRVEPARAGGSTVAGARAAVAVGTHDTWPAHAIVLAAGAWTPTLLRSAGVRVPIIAGKGYALDFTPPPVSVGHALYLHDFRVAASPYPGRLRLSGTMELTGLDTGISRRRVDAIAAAGVRWLRNWPADTKPARVASGLRPLTPDGLPVIGPLPKAAGVWLASGHSMLGVTLGPATGAALAKAIGGEEQQVLRPFDPARFA
jgi:D-amino-acid dehydrogenase